MTSIQTRVAGLERASRVVVRRQLTDVERAVRLTYLLNHPESYPSHAALTESLKRTLVAVQQRKN